ncbi:MAG: SusD/RagB family nutrient-binding outer membrane lipoprotein [Bacteroidetes bacterium]|nr:SusD/RagB family nutrient-binding outer membrane lipoprotein [Bacteroidota bacterium]
MKKIYLIFIVLMGISISCTDDFEEFNTDIKNPTEVPGDFLFANAQKALADQIASTNVNENIFKLVAQYWTETTYTDEVNYDIVGRTISDNMFLILYRNTLADLNDAKKAISAEVAAGDEQVAMKANRLYVIDILMAYTYNWLVEIFGDIPYQQALDIDNISPVYNDAEGIYDALLTKIDDAVAGIDEGYGSFGDNDLYFHGDVAMWIKFAHTLKLRMAITLADHNENLAKSIIEASYDKAFAPNELCELVYVGGSNSNPLFVDLVQSGRHDFVPANTFVDRLNELEDPRRPAYFAQNLGEGVYEGGIYGESNNWSNYTHIAERIEEPTFPITLADGIEVSFYLAEAAQRGFSVGGSAEEHYNNGIKASFEFWGLSSDDADAYIAKPEVAYDGANWKESIGEQAWIAYYLRGHLAWNTWRRLDYPELTMPPSPAEPGVIPKRFTYPVNEQTLNATNYYNASSAIGGDLQATKLFWDKF